MIYFLSDIVLDKTGNNHLSSVLRSNSLIENRDYIKISQKHNPSLFNDLIRKGFIKPTSEKVYLFTIVGVMCLLFRSQSTYSKSLIDKVMLLDYSIYDTYAYKLVHDIVFKKMPEAKRSKFFSDSVFAMEHIKKELDGDMTDEVIKSIELIRIFFSLKLDWNCLTPEFNLDYIIKEFNGFEIGW